MTRKFRGLFQGFNKANNVKIFIHHKTVCATWIHESAKSELDKIFDATIRSRQFVIVQNHPARSVIVKKKKKKKKKKEKRKKASFVKNIQVNFAIFMVIVTRIFFSFYFSQKKRDRFFEIIEIRGTFKFSMINVFTLSLIRANFLSFHV